MANSPTLPGLLDQSVESALQAFNDGYCIIASWFNAAFVIWGIDLRIEADPPPPGVTLDDCRRRLSNALLGIRPHGTQLRPDDQLIPWAVGFLCAEGGQPGQTMGGIELRENPFSPWGSAQAVERAVAVKHKCGWKNAGQWRTYVVEPMEKNANSWRGWLRQFLSSDVDADGAGQQPHRPGGEQPEQAAGDKPLAKGRRKRDSQIVRREKEIAKMLVDGKSHDEIVERYSTDGLSVDSSRKFKSRLKKSISGRIAAGVTDQELRKEFGFRKDQNRQQILKVFDLSDET